MRRICLACKIPVSVLLRFERHVNKHLGRICSDFAWLFLSSRLRAVLFWCALRFVPFESTRALLLTWTFRSLHLPSHRKVHDLPDHLGIGEAGFLRGHGKLLSAGEPWVRVRFDDINFTLARYAHINAAIIAKLDGAV